MEHFNEKIKILNDISDGKYKTFLSLRTELKEILVSLQKMKGGIEKNMGILETFTITIAKFEKVYKGILYDKDKLNYNYISIKEKSDIYILIGQIYSILSSYINDANYEYNAIKYYSRYHTLLQNYKVHDSLRKSNYAIVYSFRYYNKYSLEDLINDTITVVHPSKMNDPFDSIANLWKKKENLCNITGRKGHEEIFEKSMDFYRIRSFCANRDTFESDNSILEKIRMWSFYADNHKGFCIKYRLGNKFIKYIDENECCALRLAPVTYEKEWTIDNNTHSLNTYDAYFVKNKEWESEREVRLLSYSTKSAEKHYGEPMGEDVQIEEIVFGYLCPVEHMQTIVNLLKLKQKKICFYKMNMKQEKNIYKLVKEVYNLE